MFRIRIVIYLREQFTLSYSRPFGVCVNAPAFFIEWEVIRPEEYIREQVWAMILCFLQRWRYRSTCNCYTYSDVNGCVNRDTADIQVFALPGSHSLNICCTLCEHRTTEFKWRASIRRALQRSGEWAEQLLYRDSRAGTHTIIYTLYRFKYMFLTQHRLTIQANPAHNQPWSHTLVRNGCSINCRKTYSTYVWSTGQNTASASIDSSGHGWIHFPSHCYLPIHLVCKRDTILVTFTPLRWG